MPRCKFEGCGHEADNLGKLRKHYKDAGHPTKTREPKEPRTTRGRRGAIRAVGTITETSLLSRCSEQFDEANLDDDGRKRVLDYLFARYYPQTEEVEEGEAA